VPCLGDHRSPVVEAGDPGHLGRIRPGRRRGDAVDHGGREGARLVDEGDQTGIRVPRTLFHCVLEHEPVAGQVVAGDQGQTASAGPAPPVEAVRQGGQQRGVGSVPGLGHGQGDHPHLGPGQVLRPGRVDSAQDLGDGRHHLGVVPPVPADDERVETVLVPQPAHHVRRSGGHGGDAPPVARRRVVPRLVGPVEGAHTEMDGPDRPGGDRMGTTGEPPHRRSGSRGRQ
jgi:hypothetical protein